MKCPYCAEDIKEEAIACRYCGRDLSFFKPMLDSIYKPVLERISSLEDQISDIAASLEALKTNSQATAKPNWARMGLTTFWSFLISGPGTFVGGAILGQYQFYVGPRQYTLFTILLVINFIASLLYGGVRVGLAWPGRHLKGYTALSWLAGSLIIALVAVSGAYKLPEGLPALLLWVYCVQTLLFVSGGLFADYWKVRKQPRGERELGLAQKVANKITEPGKEANRKTVVLIQLLAPFLTTLIGLVTAVIALTTTFSTR